MKRFLSILLASMMILGCMAVTVSADAPTLALETGDTLAALATDKTVAAGRKVMVNAIADATYYHNGVAVATVAGPKANTVALPVVAGTNVYYAVVGDAKTNEVYIYGTNHTSSTAASSYRTFNGHNSTYWPVVDAALATAAAGTDAFAATATDIIDGGRTGIVIDTYTSATKYYNNDYTTFTSNTGDVAEINSDVYFPAAPTANIYAIRLTSAPGSALQYPGMLYKANDTKLYVTKTKTTGATDTGVTLDVGNWHKYSMVVYESGKDYDAYYDDVLIAKNFDAVNGQTAALKGVCLANTESKSSTSNLSAARAFLDNSTVHQKFFAVAATTATFSAVADTTANTIAVTAANLPEGAQVFLYKDGVKGAEVVLTDGEGTATIAESGTYYVQAETNGVVEIDATAAPLRSEATAFTVAGGDDPIVPVDPVLVSGSIAEGITIDRAALADPSTVVAVVAVDAEGYNPRVQLSDTNTVNNTFTVTGAARVFVWNWATLAPLHAPIAE